MATDQMSNEEPWTVRRVLDWTIQFLREHGSENPRLDAEILLAHARQCQRIQLYTQYDTPLSDEERTLMRSLVKRRAAAEPVAYLVGHREFFSLDFEVGRNVFIPRPDTETLVALALDLLKNYSSPRLLELCTGTGCIPISIARNNAKVQVTTVEKNPAPFEIATRNIAKHGLQDRIELLRGDLYQPISQGTTFDLIVSNPPYIPAAEIATLSADVCEHEPREALDGGEDGFDIIRPLIDQAPDYLNPGGWLLFELSPEQAAQACELMTKRGFTQVRFEADLSESPRVVLGLWPSDQTH